MGSPTSSVVTENPGPRPDEARARQGAPAGAPGGAARVDVVGRRRRGPRPSEAPPTGALTGVLGELAFYYGACWLHYRSAQRRGE